MLKLCEYEVIDQYGRHAEVLSIGTDMRKMASPDEYTPEIRKFAEAIQPHPKKAYILVNAMGAGEYWGSNRNGDYFPIAALKQYYNTFMNAHLFKHHVNKDPNRSYGRPIFSTYNPRMNRVELIIEIERDKAPDVADRIDNGEDIAVSMGCKCDFDVCSICAHKSPKVADYCDHLKHHMGEIMEDGRKVFAITPHPRFFDISVVFRGADPTAMMLKKVAKDNSCVSSAELGEAHYIDVQFAPKEDTEKIAAEVVDCYTSFVDDYMPILNAYEPQIDTGTLDKIAQEPLEDIFSTATGMGVIFRPQEYQRIALTKMGQAQLADQFDREGVVFDIDSQNGDMVANNDGGLFKEDRVSEKVAEHMAPYLSSRSVLEPYFSQRVLAASRSGVTKEAAQEPEKVKSPNVAALMATLALSYLAYRRFVPGWFPEGAAGPITEKLMQNPKLALLLMGGGAAALHGFTQGAIEAPRPAFAKKAGLGAIFAKPNLLHLAPIPLAYMHQAGVKKKLERGEGVGDLSMMAAKHPFTTGLGGTTALLLAGLKAAGKMKKVGSFAPVPKPNDFVKLASTIGDEMAKKVAFCGVSTSDARADINNDRKEGVATSRQEPVVIVDG
jgi:hypothetical protein